MARIVLDQIGAFIRTGHVRLAREVEMLSREMRLPLVILLLAGTLILYTGLIQAWIWQVMILILFVSCWRDMAARLRSLWPWGVFLVFLVYCAGQSWAGRETVMEGQSYGSFYPWATMRTVVYGSFFLLLGLSFSVIVRFRKFWERFLPCLAIIMFVLLFLSFVQQASQSEHVLWKAGIPVWGLFGPFSLKNHFSALIIQTMPLFLGYLYWRYILWQRAFRKDALAENLWERTGALLRTNMPFLMLLIVFMVFMTFYSMAKLAILVLSAALLIYLTLLVRFLRRRGILLLFCGVCLLVFLLFCVPEYFQTQRFSELLPDTISSRLAVIAASLEFWKGHAFFGTGLGTYYYISSQFVPYDFAIWKYAHNDYLELLVETGLLGSALILLMAVIFLGQGIMNFRRHRSLFWKIMTAQAMISLGLFAILEISDFHLKIPINAMVFLLQAGILLVPPDGQEPDPAVAVRLGMPGRIILGVSVFLGIIFLGSFSLQEKSYEMYYYPRSPQIAEQGVKRFPRSAPLWYALGHSYLKEARSFPEKERPAFRHKAAGAFAEAARLAPTFPFYWLDLADQQIELGLYSAAGESLKEAVYWGPGFSRTKKLVHKLRQRSLP